MPGLEVWKLVRVQPQGQQHSCVMVKPAHRCSRCCRCAGHTNTAVAHSVVVRIRVIVRTAAQLFMLLVWVTCNATTMRNK